MAERITWSGPVASKAKKVHHRLIIRNLPFAPGHNYRVRFIGDPIKFEKYFVDGNWAITDGGQNCIIRRKFNIEPVTRFAVHVIDRADGLLKIVELSSTMLEPIIGWGNAQKRHPGGRSACDFSIRVLRRKKSARFVITPMNTTRLKKAVSTMIAKEVPGGIDSLSERLLRIYRANPQNEIEARLFGHRPSPGEFHGGS